MIEKFMYVLYITKVNELDAAINHLATWFSNLNLGGVLVNVCHGYSERPVIRN